MKNPSADIDTIVTNQIYHLTCDKNVIGIVLFGSAARGELDSYSDVDLYCITEAEPPVSRSGSIDTKSGIAVEVLYDSADDLVAYISSEHNSAWRTITGMFSGAKVLYSKDGASEKIIACAQECLHTKTELTKAQSIMIRYSLDDFYSDAKRAYENNQPIQFALYAEKLVQNAIETSLRLNNGYFTSPKKLIPYLTQSDPALSRLLAEYYTVNNNKKLNTLTHIKEYSVSSLGGELLTNWELKN